MFMELTSPQDSLLPSSLYLSPNVSALLKINILSWSHKTGFPVCVRVRIADRTFNLHKEPLICTSGYFKEKLKDSNEVELPLNFPGAAETFETIALFIYGSSTLVEPFNIAALRCGAEFLQMTEEYGPGNLCQRFDIYLNQVVFQSWDDTLIVLQKCQTLLPWAEELLIVSRCIETLAFMACMEILDPERRRDHPVVTLDTLASKPWGICAVEDIVSQDMWIRDLIALPFAFFRRIVGSLRRQGMKEKYLSPIILFYAEEWVLSGKMHTFWQNSGTEGDSSSSNDSMENVSVVLQGIINMLPVGLKASKGIPVGFYFSLLSASLELGLGNDSTEKLQNQIASLIHLAQIEDFLQPKGCVELSVMESIFSKYFSSTTKTDQSPLSKNFIVAELWDVYLSQIASDSGLSCKRFASLIETVPVSSRQTHDHLYRSLNTFFLSHPLLSQEEKGLLCRYLNCQKLSHEVCIEAVQNEQMPLRLVVQALFIQQLNTQRAFKECSDSFRYTHRGEYYSESISSSRCEHSKSQNLVESPYICGSEGVSRPLSFLLQNDLSMQRPEFSSEISRKDYESTSLRIQNLEKELKSLKRTLKSQQMQKKSEPVSEYMQSMRPYDLAERKLIRKKKPLGQVTGCIGTVTFSSQRKYTNSLLKVFRRISLFGRRRSNREPGATARRPK